ncbi:MAG: DNA topoisomerase 3 [Flavobacteriales bacterium]|nr:DNA topoisomerase 3 [Flavobacteriales bacterium]
MKLCIAEKPSVAKDIAHILGASTRKDGYFEGNGYWVSWTFGHLCTLKEPNDYDPFWKRRSLETLPMIPSKFGIKLKENKGVEKQFKTIEQLVQKCDSVINCGDAGQEGELIQRWVLSLAKSTKPLSRLWISSLTEEAIREGFDNLKDGSDYDRLYAAGMSRAVGDWMLGMNATRLFTLKFGGKGQVLSVGRVQTPTLAMIVDRHHEIENFVSETYFELKTVYRDVVFSCTKGKIKTKDKGEELIQSIYDSEFVIDSYEQKEGKELPPKLFDLTSIQVECNKKLGLSAENTLNHVQKLYEKKLVTYPRVDTTYLSEDIYPKVKRILEKLSPYKQYTDKILGKKIRKSKKVFDNKKVTDHHAIIPTGEYPNSLSLQEKQVYDMISRRFIAAFFPDCKVSNTTVIGLVDKLKFKATGKQILDPGWRELYQSKEDSNDKEDDVMPSFEKGEKGAHKPELQEKHTAPPKYYTEASLLRAMETAGKQVDDESLRELMKENGIGRPSTRANIIETLFRRQYIERQKKRIVATPTGIDLIGKINSDLLKSAELTGRWEKKLRDIEKGTLDTDTFKAELNQMVSELVTDVKLNRQKSQPPSCPKCKKGLIATGKSAWGCLAYKNGCDFKIPFVYLGVKLSPQEAGNLLKTGKTAEKYVLENTESEEPQHISLSVFLETNKA